MTEAELRTEDKMSLQNLLLGKKGVFEENNLSKKNNSARIDRLVGYKATTIEKALVNEFIPYYMYNDGFKSRFLYEGNQVWIGLHPQVLQTNYNDLCLVFEHLKEYAIETVVDIGAAYGRVGLVMSSYLPLATFKGYEILEQRADEANRIYRNFDLEKCHVYTENVMLSEFGLPEADVYFIYDFGEMKDVSDFFDRLILKTKKKKFFLVLTGDRTSYLMEQKFNSFFDIEKEFSEEGIYIYKSLYQNS